MSSKVVTETAQGEASQASEAVQVKGKVDKKSGKRINYHYIVVKSYKKSQKNDVVKCLYIKSFTNFGFCVIKEGSRGDTKDKEGRDVIDRLKWQRQLHEELAGKIRMPRLLDSFEENGNYYLVIEHIKGRALAKEWSKKKKGLRESILTGGKLGRQFIGYLVQITDILIALHANQIVHRDATPNNYMITPGGKVALIDMEMCYSLQTKYPTPAFQLGTYGYMSPQQEATAVPTSAEDIFALGAIILQVWSGISTGKIVREPVISLKSSIPFLIPDQAVADMVLASLDPNDASRPTAEQVKDVLLDYSRALVKKDRRQHYPVVQYGREQIADTIQDAVNTLSTPLLADPEKGWFADNMAPPTEEEKHKLRKMYYASYDRGAAGIMVMLAQAKRAGFQIENCLPHIASGIELIRSKYIVRMEKKRGGLHFGSHGIAAALANCLGENLIEHSPDYLEWMENLLAKEPEGLDLKSGVAGAGLAVLQCEAILDRQVAGDTLSGYAARLAADQAPDGCWISGYRRRKLLRPRRKVVDPTLGHGMAGIIYFMLLYGNEHKHNESLASAYRGLDWLMRNVTESDDAMRWRFVKQKQLPVGLMDGLAGIALIFLKAYEITGRKDYADFARKILRTIPEKYVDGSLGQHSGVSGLGEVYLEAHKVLGDQEWLERAGWLVELIMRLRKKHPKYGTYWLVEYERQPVAGMMIGNVGVIRFLLGYVSGDSYLWATRSNKIRLNEVIPV